MFLGIKNDLQYSTKEHTHPLTHPPNQKTTLM